MKTMRLGGTLVRGTMLDEHVYLIASPVLLEGTIDARTNDRQLTGTSRNTPTTTPPPTQARSPVVGTRAAVGELPTEFPTTPKQRRQPEPQTQRRSLWELSSNLRIDLRRLPGERLSNRREPNRRGLPSLKKSQNRTIPALRPTILSIQGAYLTLAAI